MESSSRMVARTLLSVALRSPFVELSNPAPSPNHMTA